MGWLSNALEAAKSLIGSKKVGSETQSCPLKETGVLVIVVRDDNRAAISDATVDIQGKSPFSKKTDAKAIALFKPVEADTYTVKVALPAGIKDDFAPPENTQASVPLGACPIHIVEARPLAGLKVRLVTRDPNPARPTETYLDGATIHVTPKAPGPAVPDQRTAAGAAGWAPFRRLKAGEYTVAVKSLGAHASKYVVPAPQLLELAWGESRELTLEAHRRMLKIKVVEYDPTGALIKGIKVKTKGTARQNSLADKTSSDSAPAIHDLIETGDYEVALDLTDEDRKKFKVSGDTKMAVSIGAATDLQEVVFVLIPIVRIHVRLQFKDPEENKRHFPEKFPVRFAFETGDPIDAVVGKDGVVRDKAGEGSNPFIEVERRRKSVTLEFPTDKPGFIVCEKRGGSARTQDYVPETDPYAPKTPLATQVVKGARALRTPAGKWTLRNSDWEALAGGSAPPNYKKGSFIDLQKAETKVGEDKQPVELTLNPHWQYVKFEYFDRVYGHTTCSDKPITPLPLFIEGYAKSQRVNKSPEAADLATQCNWTIGANDKQLVQCVPWIVRRDDKDAELKHPTKACTLRFITDDDHRFLKSNQMAREYCALNDKHPDKHHLPCADRLRYYDMPAEWRSHHYHCRLSDKPEDQDFYELLAEKETKKDAPLIFSLDDLVLTDDKLKPIAWKYAKPEPVGTPNDRVALFSHKFSGPAAWDAGQDSPTLLDAAARDGVVPPKPQARTDRTKPGLSPDGVYLHEGKGKRHDHSAVCVPSNYIADYPDWTRLVFAQGNAHDVFDQRTSFDTNGDPVHPVGARAAVRWVESAKPAHASGQVLGSRPALAQHPSGDKQPFFATQPIFGQEFQDRDARLGSGSAPIIGRCDPILVRCCEVEAPDDKAKQLERAASIVYTRVAFKFDPGVSPTGIGSKEEYADMHNVNVCNRWNGRDAGSGKPAHFAPVDAARKLKIRAFYFAQNQPGARAHIEYEIKDPSVPANDRCFVWTHYGTGMLKPDSWKVNGFSSQVNGSVAAHEYGHFSSQPDDYGERWSWCSGGLLDFTNLTPGVPYDEDGNAMMWRCDVVRARNLWFAAEWCRIATDTKLKVEFGKDDVYHIPSHPNAPVRNYTAWPVKHLFDQTVGGHSMFDLYLYMLGEDVTSKIEFKLGGTIDAVLVVVVKIDWDFSQITPSSWALDAVTEIDQHVRSKCNRKFYATGDVTVDGESKSLKRCAIIVQPRYLLSNCTDDAPSVAEKADYDAKVIEGRAKSNGPHFDVAVSFYNPPAPLPPPAPPPPPRPLPIWSGGPTGRRLAYAIDGGDPARQVREIFYNHFREMIGLTAGNADPDPTKLNAIASLILSNSSVKRG